MDSFLTIFEGVSFAEKRNALLRHLEEYSRLPLPGSGSFYAIRNQVIAGGAVVLSAEWMDYRRSSEGRYSPYDAPDILKEQTYEKCYRCSLELADLTVTVTLLKGDMVHGEPVGKDAICRFNVQLTEAMVEEHFSMTIERELVDVLSEADEQEQERLRALRMRKIFHERFSVSSDTIAEAV